MLDKVLVVNKNKVVIFFTHREPVTIHSDSGQALKLADELLCPINNAQVKSATEYSRMKRASDEDTQILEIEKLA